MKDLIVGMKDIPTHEVKQRELAYKATKDVLRGVSVSYLHRHLISIRITIIDRNRL